MPSFSSQPIVFNNKFKSQVLHEICPTGPIHTDLNSLLTLYISLYHTSSVLQ